MPLLVDTRRQPSTALDRAMAALLSSAGLQLGAGSGVAEPLFRAVPRKKRVASWVERSGAGMAIDVASSLLSLLTVATYMAETAFSESSHTWLALRGVDLACSVVFGAEWCFWLWLARDRLAYALSFQSLIDVLTVVPLFCSLFISRHLPGFAAFESMVRIVRIVRVFRIFRLGKRLKSEVQSRLLVLVFTLIAIIIVGAGLFYEIETRWGDARYAELTMMQAIYFSTVTTTTIGYGDFTPSVMASQALLLLMLGVAFTLLPYQTSTLVTALSETSVYRSAHYSSAAKGPHVVLTGHIDAASAAAVVDELLHPDSGFSDYHLVCLSPEAPSATMRLLLKTHRHAHRLLYLQGSALCHQDLARAQVDACDAVFVLCDKRPADAAREDLTNSMACLAIGHHCQLVQRTRQRPGPRPIGERVAAVLGWLLRRLRKSNRQPSTMPSVFVQLLLPESRQELYSLLQQYAQQQQQQQQQQPASSAPGDAHSEASASGPLAEVLLHAAGGGKHAASGPQQSAGSCSFWAAFPVTAICLSEVKFGLLAAGCLGVPGALPLVSNLVRSVDDELLLDADFNALPAADQEYLEGSSSELYELPALPQHLQHEPLTRVAAYLHAVHHAVLLATCSEQPAGGRAIRLLPLDLCAGSGGLLGTQAWVIAADCRVVLDIVEADAAAYDAWLAQQHATPAQRQPLQQQLCQLCCAGGSGGAGAAGTKQAPSLGLVSAQHGTERSRSPSPGRPTAAPAAPELPTTPVRPASPSDAADVQVSGLVVAASPEPPARDPPSLDRSARATGELGASSRRASSERGAGSRRATAAGLAGTSVRLLAALGSNGGGQPDAAPASVHSGRRRHRAAIQINPTRTASWGTLDLGPGSLWAESPEARAPGSAHNGWHSWQRLHTRCGSSAECLQAMLRPEREQLHGHILVCGHGTPPQALLCLLRPLRNAAPQPPVVVLDGSTPSLSEWDELARLADVFYLHGSVHDRASLALASAATAAAAVVLQPWAAASDGGAQPAWLLDAATMTAVRSLRALNPELQVMCELSCAESLPFLGPSGSLLPLHAGAAAAAAATRAFMAGAVQPGNAENHRAAALAAARAAAAAARRQLGQPGVSAAQRARGSARICGCAAGSRSSSGAAAGAAGQRDAAGRGLRHLCRPVWAPAGTRHAVCCALPLRARRPLHVHQPALGHAAAGQRCCAGAGRTPGQGEHGGP